MACTIQDMLARSAIVTIIKDCSILVCIAAEGARCFVTSTSEMQSSASECCIHFKSSWQQKKELAGSI